MTAPRTCPNCGDNLDAGEVCTCQQGAAEAAVETTGSMEFVMGHSLETMPQTIDFNFEALKMGLTQSLARYDGLVFAEDDIKGAKEDRAKLNKLREALESQRKEVKKELMAPYTDFEARVKELVAMVDKPIAAIDAQLKSFEEQRREEKKAAVLEIYEETIGDLRDLLSFEKVWRDEWYNVGMSLKRIRESIVALEAKVASDLDVLSTVESEFSEEVKVKYLDALDLNAALAEHKMLQREAEKLRAYKAKNAAMEKLEAAAPAGVAKAKEDIPQAPHEPPVEVGQPTAAEEPRYRLAFECIVTKAQAQVLSEYLKSQNITYRRI